MKFQTAESARTYATFLPQLADKAPRLVNKQMSLLIQHLDNEVRRTAAECTVAASAYPLKAPCVVTAVQCSRTSFVWRWSRHSAT